MKYTALTLILTLLTFYSLNFIFQNTNQVDFVKKNDGLIEKLESILFSGNAKSIKTRDDATLVLNEILDTKDVELIDGLEEIYDKIISLKNEGEPYRYSHEHNYVISFRYGIEAALIELKMIRDGIENDLEMFQYVKDEMIDDFSAPPVDVTGELLYLKKNATRNTDFLIESIKSDLDDKIKIIFLDALKMSEKNGIENDILSLSNSLKDNLSLFRRTINIAAIKGDIKTANHFINLYDSANSDLKKSIIHGLKILREKEGISDEAKKKSVSFLKEHDSDGS